MPNDKTQMTQITNAQEFLEEILKELSVKLPEDCGTRFRLINLIQKRDFEYFNTGAREGMGF